MQPSVRFAFATGLSFALSISLRQVAVYADYLGGSIESTLVGYSMLLTNTGY
jgi:hypothetical protein